MKNKPRQATRQERPHVTGKQPGTLTVERRHTPSSTRIAVRPVIELTESEVARLMLEAICGIRTVQRWAAGRVTSRTTNLRLLKAMEKLGIERREKGRAA